MTSPARIPLRRLSVLLGAGNRDPQLLATMKQEFAIGDLGEHAERPVGAALGNALLAWLHARTGERSFGLELGLGQPINADGALGALLAASPNLLAALGEFSHYYPLLAWDDSSCRLLPHARGTLLEIAGFEIEAIADSLRLDIVLGRLLKLAQRISGADCKPLLLVYPEAAGGVPADIAALAAQSVSARNRLALLFTEADLHRAAAHPNEVLVQALKPELDRELQLLLRPQSLAAQLLDWFASMESLAGVSQAGAAQHVHLSESSLKRHLAEEETSFSDLLQGYRRDRALELLTTTDDKLESIALALGFSERASFERAFKGWFDATPASYREQMRRVAGEESGGEVLDLDTLPASPRVCLQILELLGRDNYHMDELVRLVNLDPALAARILGTARSAFYGGRTVRSLDEAIAKVVGVDQVRYLALIAAANTEFSRNLPPSFDLRRYWLDALQRTFLVTALLDSARSGAEAGRYETCLAALLLDIGSYLLAHLQPARSEEFLQRRQALAPGADVHALEREVFGTGTRAAGALLMTHWNLPQEAVRIVRELDAPGVDAEIPAGARIVAAAAAFVQEGVSGADQDAALAAFVAAIAPVTGLDAGLIERAAERQRRQAGEMESLVAQLLG